MKNYRKFILILMILALVLAACVDEPTPAAEEPAGAADTAEEPVEEPAEEPESSEPEPTEAPAEVESMEPILIGGIHPLTGGLAADGIQMDNAIQMAIAELNAAGGVLGGRQFEYQSADSTGSAEVGQTEAERLVNEGVAAIICCFQSAVTSNVAAIAEREGVPLVIDVAVADAILDQGYEYTFRLQPNATSMGVNGADFLQEMSEATGEEINSVVYLFEGTTGFGDSVRAAFVERAAELGIEVVDEIGYDPFGVTDLTTEMTRINALAPDALVVTGYYNDGLLAARNAEDVGLDVKLIYGVAQGTYDQSQFVADAGDLSQCFFDSNYHWDASDTAAAAVRQDFADQYGEEMRTSAILAYQAMYIIADAIERAGSADPAVIRDALAETDYADHILPYEGAISFDDAGETVVASPVVMQVQDGAVYQVWPSSLAERTPLFPCVSWNPDLGPAAVTPAEGPLAGETVLLGGIHPLTGGLAADGIQMDNAIEMAIAEINAAGGALGAELAYLSADSTGSAEVGQTEAERLINDGAVALICCFQSAVTSNVAAISEREGVPLVIDVAVADAILDQGYAYTFRLQPNATSMGVNGANFLKELADATGEEINTAVYLFEGTTGYGDSVRAAFIEQAAELGIEVIDEIGYDPFGVTDLTTEMTRINAQAPDALVVTGYYNDGLLAARNAEDVGLNVKVVYGVAQGTYDQPQFVEDAGDLAQCFLDSNYHWDASDENALAVRDRFAAEYGEEMRTSAVLAYQATYLIADAIERGGSVDPSAIRDALAETNYADHILPYLGPISFDDTGETVVAAPVMMQVQDGAVYQVWPPDLAEREPIFPCVSWNQ
jgi:branched-chain amino acid transport system substrate-binding protein